EFGLGFNSETCTIEGSPNQSGNLSIRFLFKVQQELEESPANEKIINLVVNPDPKTLWKNLPSNPQAIFSKKDDDFAFSKLGEKHIVVASKRGRSHQNVGSFREDDFAFSYNEKTKWSVVAVSDGAGTYPLS